MIIFPAIDLKGGRVVRLAEGDMARATVYADDPAAQARAFAGAGAGWLHVVDLDGAFAGEGRNVAAVEAILAATPAKVQLGGGIRTRDAIERWLSLGVERVVMGTAALEDPGLVRAAAAAHPGRIVVAVDARGGRVATRGWADVSDLAVAELARRFEDAGIAALLFTDVGRDGLLKGVNLEATVELARATALPVIASGGVADLRDIEALRHEARAFEDGRSDLGDVARSGGAGPAAGGIEGVICGRAIYDGRLDLADALKAAA